MNIYKKYYNSKRIIVDIDLDSRRYDLRKINHYINIKKILM